MLRTDSLPLRRKLIFILIYRDILHFCCFSHHHFCPFYSTPRYIYMTSANERLNECTQLSQQYKRRWQSTVNNFVMWCGVYTVEFHKLINWSEMRRRRRRMKREKKTEELKWKHVVETLINCDEWFIYGGVLSNSPAFFPARYSSLFAGG